MRMDDKWFKHQQKLANVTAEDIARVLNKDRSVVSRIYTGRQKMSLEWAQAFAQIFNVPVGEVLKRAGAVDAQLAQQFAPGYSDSDAAPFVAKASEQQALVTMAEALGGNRPGIDVWIVKSRAMALAGLLVGDYMLVDTHQAERVKAGNIVIAQIYNNNSGSAMTVLRQFQPPVLVAQSADPEENRVNVVDGVNVVIRGKVIASWRV